MPVADSIVRFTRGAARRGSALACALLSMAAASCSTGPQAGGPGPLPVVYSLPAAAAFAGHHPGGAPPGADDWACVPSAAHPRPVVLVHGTLESMAFDWFSLSPLLKDAGYCVYALDYGRQAADHGGESPLIGHLGGSGPIEQSAVELARFVDRVLAATGTSRVDIVGHSQGGMMPRYYMKFGGGAPRVANLIGLSPSNHGRSLDPLLTLIDAPGLLGYLLGPALREQAAGSALLHTLNAGGDTLPGVRYSVIETRFDEVITPYTSAFLAGPGVTNTLLQDQCRLDFSDHTATPFDSIALRDVLNALDPANAVAPRCHLVRPFIGG